ncbi:MAG: hypothetical protein JWP95_1414 [Actinotalea sp.]|nr:hypothetical protein [Actinotalea sp.]
MEILYKVLLVLHLIGMAMIVGGWLVTIRSPRMLPGMWHGALTQLVTGVAMVGLASSGAVDHEIDDAKAGVKLVIALTVAVLVFLGQRRGKTGPNLVHAVGGLALLNVLIAVLWG